MDNYPKSIEGGNSGDGSPLVLGDPQSIGDLFLESGNPILLDWDGDGRGRTKIQVVDWDHNGTLDLVLGVGPQPGSAFYSSYVLLCRNVGSSAAPLFKRPEALLFNAAGKALEFWRHAVHPGLVDWDGDGAWEILAGADLGFVWYFKPEYFGKPQGRVEIYRKKGDISL